MKFKPFAADSDDVSKSDSSNTTNSGADVRHGGPTAKPANEIGWERLLFAAAVAAAVLVILAVSIAAIVVREAGNSPGKAAPFMALGALVLALALIPLGRRNRGPLPAIARRVPRDMDGGYRRRPVVACLAGALVIVGVLQTARLSCFMADPTLRWASAYPPEEFGVRHMCISAYVQAADLVRRGVPNLYAEEHYPAFDFLIPGERPARSSTVENLIPHLRDAFEYPPPFLLLPRAALVLTNDFLVIRTGWFMIQAPLFIAFALALAWQVGGRRGTVASILVFGLLASFPFLFNFQFGQFHLAAIVLAMGGMLAFSKGRDPLGGALLAVAVVTKIFPALLLIYLALRKRGRAVLWTVAFSAAYALAALFAFGAAPYRAFFGYQLPRFLSGEAFSFFKNTDLTLAANASIYAIPFKLQRLGVPGMSEGLASGLVWIFTALLIAATVIAVRRRRDSSLEPAVWLALLALCGLRSPDAPNVYIGAAALWALSLVAVETRGRAAAVVLLVFGWICMSVQPPLPDPKATIALWMSGQVAILAFGFWVMLRRSSA
jgi:hypothetical protein